MKFSRTARRVVATAVLAVPFGFAVPVLAAASGPDSGSADSGSAVEKSTGTAWDDGGSRGDQDDYSRRGGEAFQAGDLVAAALQVNPAANVGGIANSGTVDQSNEQDQDVVSGISQGGGSRGGGGPTAVQGGSLLGLDLQVAPAVNVGGILSSGDVHQSNEQDQDLVSGIRQR